MERREVGSLHHGSRLGGRRILDILPQPGTRGVDDHVGYTVFATHSFGQGEDLLAGRGIARLDDGICADAPSDDVKFGTSSGHENDAIAGLRQVPRRVRADTARRTGDQCEFHVRSVSCDVSENCGDRAGFDILSFDDVDDGEPFIEVKTTGLGKDFPFLLIENERRCSEDLTERFQLDRVFDFSRRPMVYVLTGALSQTCQLEPVQYRASVVGESTDQI